MSKDSMVEVHFSKRPLSKVLQDLSQRYALNFSYANDHLPLQKKITFHSEGLSLRQTLDLLFEQNDIVYAYIGEQVVLKPSNARARKKAQRQQRKERRNARERETLQRGRLFKRDWHPVTPKPQLEVPPVDRPAPLDTTMIEPLVVTKIGTTAPLQQVTVVMRADHQVVRKVVRPRLAQVSFLPQWSTNPYHKKAIHISSLNLLWGNNGGVYGLEIGVLGNRLTRPMEGMQVSPGFNWVENDVMGWQIGGVFNYNQGDLYGWQLSGLFNGSENSHGWQLAGLGNLSRNLYGTQMSLLSNIATDVYGFQLAGLTNFANGKLYGAQIGGVGNIAWGGKSAVQLAGMFNYSATAQFQIAAGFNVAQLIDGAQLSAINGAKRVNGIQLGAVNYTQTLDGAQVGVLNVARHVKGTMVGLINIVDSIQGVPLGLINIVRKNGYNRFELSTGDVLYCRVGLMMGVPHLYYKVQLGWQVNARNEYIWSAGLGVGTSFALHPRWRLQLEWMTLHINEDAVWTPELNLLNQLCPSFAYQFNERMSWFIGPTFNLLISNVYHRDLGRYGSNLAPYTLIDGTNRNDVNFKGWIGATMGLRF